MQWNATTLARSILYHDRALIVVNKPHSLVAQATSRANHKNVVDFDKMLTAIKKHLGLDELPYPLHRLDKPTTGVLVLAKHKKAAQQLSQQFQSREVQKSYLALVRAGKKTFQTNTGIISAPLVIEDGHVALSTGTAQVEKSAITSWELLASSQKAPLSLVRLQLHTGLKHQLRVHLSRVLGAPILGDALYTRTPPADEITSLPTYVKERLYLHAHSISLHRYRREGPNKRYQLTVAAPPPLDFLKLCKEAGLTEELDEDTIRGGVFVDGIQEVCGIGIGHTARTFG
ncbi:pseudouridine synthase [Stereum hirsutum FP-91666 SS1]|uniref:pseudouridine synthase n=1 Tax=Stereum hirsutum (strain FP-91666) TaxID=721885 RepID=UPI000444A73C|nr:pseudouridine synthase [Stereum hirsutum FP-91666 SS1]EIM83093.1 pseudouridine synthase [Stereum hirsutum FP-91666 SS1]